MPRAERGGVGSVYLPPSPAAAPSPCPLCPQHLCTLTSALHSPPTVTQPWERPALCPLARWTQHNWLRGSTPLPTSTSLAQLWPRRTICSQALPSRRPHRAGRPRHAESVGGGQGQRAENTEHTGCRKRVSHRDSENWSYRSHRPLSSQRQVPRTNPTLTPAHPRPLPSHHSWSWGHPAEVLTWVPPPLTTCHQAEPLAFSLLGSCKTPPLSPMGI